MTAFLLAPFYILVNVYVVRWMIRWMGACSHIFQSAVFRAIFIIFYILIASSLLTGFLINKPEFLHRILKTTGNYFLGTFLYIILVIVVGDLIRLILKYVFHARFLEFRSTFVITGFVCMALIILISVYGILHVGTIKVTPYEVTVNKKVKDMDSLKIVLLADTHFGYSINCRHAQKMAEKINAQDPDIVCIAGDIFDNDYDAISDPEGVCNALKSIKSRYGVYACWGNHDLDEPILAGFTFGGKKKDQADPRMEQLLRDANIHLLTDEAELIDDKFYVVGRNDSSRTHKLGGQRLSPAQLTKDLDLDKPVIFIDHQPKQLQETADAGADLDLCGHTHDGQIFPGNLFIHLFWENSFGYLKKDNMHNIVTSGVGVWGPDMRVGTNCEICPITVHFQ
ncbi:metallophosphoesterase [Blautia glucerasea]|uniref:metallophosphoesterase n=1 Tax=Blautia glucerasea TaxID=536633 RepID=UPI00156F3684|nr:metallophosphoesterase [Blautia glucerasea]NSJ28578.1 metallophosphoesterase [Blautia glucerasea]